MIEPDPDFEALLEHVKVTRGFDFTGYKRSSLSRRVDRRMAAVGVTSYADYLDFLELNADEFTALFNTILINVTGFFRDPPAWDHLAKEVLPGLLAGSPTAPLRVWSAGCATGEEAYTLAIVLAELLGPEEFRDRVKIYATDVDEEALSYARHGTYSERELAGLDPGLVEKYFERSAGRLSFRKDLRRSVIFGRNDLVQDAPISRIDLLACRNALMYFTAETQARILTKFHFALSNLGVLFLGKAEMLLSHGAIFVPIDLKRRIFRKAGPPPSNGTPFGTLAPLPRPELTGLDLLRNEALLAAPLAQVVVTSDGLLAMVNRQAELTFGVSNRDVGRPFRDLELSYRPLELRRYIEQAQSEGRGVRVTDVTYARGSEILNFDVQLTPLVGAESIVLGVSIAFDEVTDFRRLQDELEQTNRRLETAYEELQSTNEELEATNEELQSTVEELETTNEELQSSNEELETMNEELETMNEELETMNEELQSTNDELQAINDELQVRSDDLDQANNFLESILTSLRAGIIVVGPELQVRVWNRQSRELWGLRGDEAVGEHFLNLDIGLPTQHIRPMIRQTLAGDAGPHEVVLRAVNRRGRAITVRVLAGALYGTDGSVDGVILTMEETDSEPTTTTETSA